MLVAVRQGGEEAHTARHRRYDNCMEKERITKDDGRYLIYYRFGDEQDGAADRTKGTRKHGCQTDGCDGTSPDGSSAGKGGGTCRN